MKPDRRGRDRAARPRNEITLPEPGLRFPEPGWRERLLAYAERARAAGLELEARLEPGAPDEALTRLENASGPLPADLRALLREVGGGRIGHLTLIPEGEIAAATRRIRAREGTPDEGYADVAGGELVAFALDLAGNPYARASGKHAVVYLSRDPAGVEHRFTSLGTFLEAAAIRAWAAALHRRAEADRGDDLDDQPWIEAARRAELRIDPAILRTRED